MTEKITDEVAVRVRKRLRNGIPGNPPINNRSRFERTPLCAKEVVSYATSQDFCGFEDPKSAALDYAQHQDRSYKVVCGRIACGGAYEVDHFGTRAKELSPCTNANECLKEDVDHMKSMQAEGIETDDVLNYYPASPSQEQIGWRCMKLTCDFSFGYTFTSDGTSGTCAKQAE